MKKAIAEVGSQQDISDLVARLGEIEKRITARLDDFERRLEKLDPTPSLQTREPYEVGSQIYSIVDAYARNPLTIVGYERGTGRILVLMSPGDACPRSLPLESVRPLAKCPNAEPSPEQVHADLYARMDPATRRYWEGRKAAEIAAKVTAPPPPPPKQRRYFGEQDQIPTYGISVGTGESR